MTLLWIIALDLSQYLTIFAQFLSLDRVNGFPTMISRLLARVIMTFSR